MLARSENNNDQYGVIQVLEGGGEGARHRKVPEHVGAPEQIEGGPAVPILAVAQCQRHQGIRNGLVHLRRGAVVQELVVRVVGVGLPQERDEVRRGLRSREMIR